MNHRNRIFTAVAGTALLLSPLALPSQAGAAVSEDDKKFVENAASGGLTEVKLGQYAAENASSAQVKRFGQHMVDDHTKANKQLQQLASKEGIDVASSISSEDQAMVDKLTALKGAEFDKAYISAMVDDHKKDVAEFQKEADSGSDPALKSWAGRTLATLQKHLQHAQQVDKSVNKS